MNEVKDKLPEEWIKTCRNKTGGIKEWEHHGHGKANIKLKYKRSSYICYASYRKLVSVRRSHKNPIKAVEKAVDKLKEQIKGEYGKICDLSRKLKIKDYKLNGGNNSNDNNSESSEKEEEGETLPKHKYGCILSLIFDNEVGHRPEIYDLFYFSIQTGNIELVFEKDRSNIDSDSNKFDSDYLERASKNMKSDFIDIYEEKYDIYKSVERTVEEVEKDLEYSKWEIRDFFKVENE